MIVLLDTCAALWIMENDWLRPEAVAAIDQAYDRGEKVRVSPITGWEIGLSAAGGRFRSRLTPQRWLAALLARPEIGLAELPPHVLLESSSLPGSLTRAC